MKTEPTFRQREVLAQVCRGLSNKEIAKEMGLKPLGVKSHIQMIARKLECTGRTQLAVLALQRGYVDLEKLTARP